MHTMQENDTSGNTENTLGNGYLEGNHERGQARQDSQKDVKLIAAAVVGMLLPLVTQLGHAH